MYFRGVCEVLRRDVWEEVISEMTFWDTHADAIITSFITIVGFIITIAINQRSIRNEIRKEKVSTSIKVIQGLPFEICQILDSIVRNKKPFSVNDYSSIMDRVLSYGSVQAVTIVIGLQELSYLRSEEEKDFGIKLMALFCLLITQLKYDLTDEIVPPDSWMRMRLNDFDSTGKQMRDILNMYIDKLGLERKFRISD